MYTREPESVAWPNACLSHMCMYLLHRRAVLHFPLPSHLHRRHWWRHCHNGPQSTVEENSCEDLVLNTNLYNRWHSTIYYVSLNLLLRSGVQCNSLQWSTVPHIHTWEVECVRESSINPTSGNTHSRGYGELNMCANTCHHSHPMYSSANYVCTCHAPRHTSMGLSQWSPLGA